MPRFEPFAGLRYDPAALAARGSDLDDVIAPPYDVIDPAGRAGLVGRSPYNAVRVELPEPEGGLDRYRSAAALLAQWRQAGVLRVDDQPGFYLYAMSFVDGAGRARRTLGVLGALEVSPAEQGAVLPHERTMPKPRSDRLDLLRACSANLSPVWGLSLAGGLSVLCEAETAGVAPDAAAVDGDGVTHSLWVLTDPAAVAGISKLVASAPVLLADGHHRYETGLAYMAERRAETGDVAGDYDLVLALVVELAGDQLAVGPIHRLVSGLPRGYDLVGALGKGFDLQPLDLQPAEMGPPGETSVVAVLEKAGGPVLVTGNGSWQMRAHPDLAQRAEDDLDSSRLDLVLADLAPHELSYHHDPGEVIRAVEDGRARAGILIRPASVEVIARAARERRRLPAKSTFFTPKPRTGMVFRLLR